MVNFSKIYRLLFAHLLSQGRKQSHVAKRVFIGSKYFLSPQGWYLTVESGRN